MKDDKKNKATSMEQLPGLLSGRPAGTLYKIEGYVDSSGKVYNLTVRSLGPAGYSKLKRESLEILHKEQAPTVPGFPPHLVAQARDALITSYSAQSTVERADGYKEASAGGYSVKDGSPAIYLLRLESISQNAVAVDMRQDLVRAKAALVRALDLPAGRYMHSVKLAEGKFVSVEVV